MCFDKTGTLTEEGLDMYGVRGVFINSLKIVKFDDLDPNPQKLINGSNSNNNYFNFGDPKLLLLEIMASCHGLTMVQGNLIGDPLEVKMFESTGWVFEEDEAQKYDAFV